MIRPSRGLARSVACTLLVLSASLRPALAGPDDTNADTGTNSVSSPAPFTADTVTKQYFGRSPHNTIVSLYTLTNKNGMSVSVMDYGATIVSIRVPDRDGKIDDVVLGYDKFTPYLAMKDYFGATPTASRAASSSSRAPSTTSSATTRPTRCTAACAVSTRRCGTSSRSIPTIPPSASPT
jgi:hypothetical protein